MKKIIATEVQDDTYVMYYWYDHLLLRSNGDAEKVQKSIEDHDFDAFMKFVDKYPPYTAEEDGVLIPFFPPVAYRMNEDGDTIEEINVFTPEGFAQIDESEFECG